MQDLQVIGVDSGALLVASDDGTRFRIPIDEVLKSRLRQATPDQGSARKLGPKEIQAHIRSGMSAEDVASITGSPIEYIERFEGPVIAEREFVVKSALEVPVHTAADTSPMQQGRTFGTAITERLVDLGASNERWASWKEESGWVVKLAFTANEIDHDARWQFDPKKHALSPLNNEAVQLSQQGEPAAGLIPRLRAVSPTQPVDTTRFDSGAFAIDESIAQDEPAAVPVSISRPRPVEDDAVQGNQTADLLEALRRRRGEREAANFEDDEDARSAHPSTGGIRIVELDVETDLPDDLDEFSLRSTAPQPGSRGRKGRASMPSWDEIVFGARSDEDPA